MSQDIQAQHHSPMPPPTRSQRAARDELLRSTVRFARLMFDAYACSVFLYRADDDMLVLEATSEHREDRLLSIQVPSHAGIAGWVFQSGETMAIDNLAESPQFDLASAQATGYVPTAMLVAPLEMNGDTFGVLEILDPARQVRGDMETLDLVQELARQCCASMASLGQLPGLGTASAASDVPSRLVEDIYRLSEDGGRAGTELIAALRTVVQAAMAAHDG